MAPRVPTLRTIYGSGLKTSELNRTLRKAKKPTLKNIRGFIFDFGFFCAKKMSSGVTRKLYPTSTELKEFKKELDDKEVVFVPYMYLDQKNPKNNHGIGLVYERSKQSVTIYDIAEDEDIKKIINKDLRRTFRQLGLPIKKNGVQIFYSNSNWPVPEGCCVLPICIAEQMNEGKMPYFPEEEEVWKCYDLIHSDNKKTLLWAPHK